MMIRVSSHLGPRPSSLYAVLFSLIMTALIFAAPARADYKFCNASSYVLASAVAHEKADAWRSQGWHQLLPGNCKSVLPGGVSAGSYYVFARSIDAHQGGTKYFGGTDRFCVVSSDFEITGRDACLARGFDTQDFAHIDTQAGSNWVTTFAEARDFTLERAKIAGTQRLLRDNGHKISRIDGYGGRNTTRAIMSFQRSINVKPSGTITPALFQAMIAGAEKEQQKTGFDVCNQTDYLVWAAVAQEIATDEFESSGWIRIEPGACRKTIKGKLTQSHYYLYSEAVDDNGDVARRDGDDLIWDGSYSFCTKSTRFQIKGSDNCAERGFDEAEFRKIDTAEAAQWTETLQ